jgi:hypothetical protein
VVDDLIAEDDGMLALGSLPQLMRLSLHGMRDPSSSLRHLAPLTGLQRLDLRLAHIDGEELCSNFLLQLGALTSLTVRPTSRGPLRRQLPMRLLAPSLCRIRELRLSDHTLGDDDLACVSCSLLLA